MCAAADPRCQLRSRCPQPAPTPLACASQVKEPLLKDEQIIVGSRAVVATEFTERGRFDATTSIPP